jgi:hypothetical protein
MPRIIFRPSLLKIRRMTVKWIILHDTIELYDRPEIEIDTPKYQYPILVKSAMEKAQVDLNYHYIMEKVSDDYIAIATRPITHLCEWDDIDPNINNRSLHIAILGNYNYKVPENRLYNVLAYRVVSPLMKIYALSENRIKLHSEVSSNNDLVCPGEFFDKGLFLASVRRYWIR